MAFTPKDWKDLPDITTPLSAPALEDMETRLSGYTDSREAAVRTDFATGDASVLSAAQAYTNTQIANIQNVFRTTMNWTVPGTVSSSAVLLPQYVTVQSGVTVKLVSLFSHMYNLASGHSVQFDIYIGGTNRTGGTSYVTANRFASGLTATSAGTFVGGTPVLDWTFESGQWIGFQVTSIVSGTPSNWILSAVLETTL